jgi:hypothetical protein
MSGILALNGPIVSPDHDVHPHEMPAEPGHGFHAPAGLLMAEQEEHQPASSHHSWTNHG